VRGDRLYYSPIREKGGGVLWARTILTVTLKGERTDFRIVAVGKTTRGQGKKGGDRPESWKKGRRKKSSLSGGSQRTLPTGSKTSNGLLTTLRRGKSLAKLSVGRKGSQGRKQGKETWPLLQIVSHLCTGEDGLLAPAKAETQAKGEREGILSRSGSLSLQRRADY